MDHCDDNATSADGALYRVEPVRSKWWLMTFAVRPTDGMVLTASSELLYLTKHTWWTPLTALHEGNDPDYRDLACKYGEMLGTFQYVVLRRNPNPAVRHAPLGLNRTVARG